MFLDASRGVLKVTGEDRQRFLQGLITNDLQRLNTEGDVIYTAMLSPKGRYWFDFFIVRVNESFYIIGQRIDEIYKRITPYKLRLDVQLERLNEYRVYGTFKREELHNEFLTFQDPRHSELPLWGMSTSGQNVNEDAMEYHRRRFKYAIPESQDFEFDKSIILEWGFERLNGISFTKGCYMGQELMSRTKHLGQIRKQLMSFRFDQLLPLELVGQDVTVGENNVGVVKAVFENYALALVRLEYLPENFLGVEILVDGKKGVLYAANL